VNNALAIKKPGRWAEFIFFGNYFYGLCAVALSVEATLQQHFPLNGIIYFTLIFLSTVLYYTYPYVRKSSFSSSNPRTNWYSRNYVAVRNSQIIITLILLAALLAFLWNYGNRLLNMPLMNWILILVFPVSAAFYYGTTILSRKYNIRKIGWLKPFVIGFIWAGMVTIYPVLFYCIIHEQPYLLTEVGLLLFLKNLMFVAVLCIMFDIKDYAADYLSRLKTFVVNIGLRKTIFYILIPLSVAGLGSFIYYAGTHHFHPVKILLNVLPFIFLAVVAWSLRRRRSIMYYLVTVDGLMLVKAICGTLAITLFP
jgi:hypothetical protein